MTQATILYILIACYNALTIFHKKYCGYHKYSLSLEKSNE